jgi:peptidoglycan hydrolase-like protein with peptidoglycan-binding domain
MLIGATCEEVPPAEGPQSTTTLAVIIDDGDASDAADAATPDTPAAAFEEECRYERLDYTVDETIQFAPGTSGTTISKALEASSRHGYSLDAAAGQTMIVSVSGGAIVDIFDDEASYLGTGPDVTLDLPTTGTYYIDVSSETCDPLAYDLVIDIPTADQAATPPAGTGDQGAGPCPNYTDFTTASGQDWPMRLCQQGPLVRTVQQALKDLGFNVDVDGFFGPGTRDAVGAWRGDGVGELIPSDVESLLPGEDDEAAAGPGPTTPPLMMNDFYQLTVGVETSETYEFLAGDRVSVGVIADPTDGTDPTVTLIDPSGAVVAFDDDGMIGEGPLDAYIEVTIASSGAYRIVATSVNGVSGFVQINVDING